MAPGTGGVSPRKSRMMSQEERPPSCGVRQGEFTPRPPGSRSVATHQWSLRTDPSAPFDSGAAFPSPHVVVAGIWERMWHALEKDCHAQMEIFQLRSAAERATSSGPRIRQTPSEITSTAFWVGPPGSETRQSSADILASLGAGSALHPALIPQVENRRCRAGLAHPREPRNRRLFLGAAKKCIPLGLESPRRRVQFGLCRAQNRQRRHLKTSGVGRPQCFGIQCLSAHEQSHVINGLDHGILPHRIWAWISRADLHA